MMLFSNVFVRSERVLAPLALSWVRHKSENGREIWFVQKSINQIATKNFFVWSLKLLIWQEKQKELEKRWENTWKLEFADPESFSSNFIKTRYFLQTAQKYSDTHLFVRYLIGRDKKNSKNYYKRSLCVLSEESLLLMLIICEWGQKAPKKNWSWSKNMLLGKLWQLSSSSTFSIWLKSRHASIPLWYWWFLVLTGISIDTCQQKFVELLRSISKSREVFQSRISLWKFDESCEVREVLKLS
jgi:hypothetical protein